MASTYITVYHKETGEPALTYAATVKEWLAAGYTTTPPADAKKPPEALRAKLPSAGREANRDNPIISGVGRELGGVLSDGNVPAAAAEPAPEPAAESAPVKPAPRRRVSAD